MSKRVLAVGLGNMGRSHAIAYTKIPGVEVAGVCTRHADRLELPPELAGAERFTDAYAAIDALRPEIVSVNTMPDTHADIAIAAMERGAHVFVEKPLAISVDRAQAVADTAARTGRKVVVGYILRRHPSWQRFVEIARELGSPKVFRMNLNQQSTGETWAWHKRLMESFPPIVDCGVHYVDVMCQMTDAKPVRVYATGAHLTDEVPVYNYGMLQVSFADGSVGWYEAGWGPMMSETAFFVKDVVGPAGSVSIEMAGDSGSDGGEVHSDDINAHTKTNRIRWHHTDPDRPDDLIDMADEPGHDDLCLAEQEFLVRAIDEDLDLSAHVADAVTSLRIVVAADESVRTGQVVSL